MWARVAIPLLLMLAPRILPRILRFARLVWRLSFDKRVPIVLRLLLPLAIIYIISPIDLVKDTVPILGRFDDLIVVALALLLLVKLAPREVVDEHNGITPPSNRPEDKDPSNVVDGASRLVDEE